MRSSTVEAMLRCSCCSKKGFARHLEKLTGSSDKASSHYDGDKGSGSVLKAVAFGAVMLASSALNNLFVTYHLDFFLTVVQVQSTYFYLGHLVFMVWNACNDVLFGWISDTVSFGGKGARRSRLTVIRHVGTLWAAVFFVVWFPWSGPGTPLLAGLNFALNLCIYDGMLTFVEVNHHALLAELSVDSAERARYNRWNAICAAAGSLTSWCGHVFWNKRDLFRFRLFALAVASGACICFHFAARELRTVHKSHKSKGGAQVFGADLNDDKDDPAGKGTSKTISSSSGGGGVLSSAARFVKFARELGQQQNFIVFATVLSLQTFDCALGKNFFTLFLELLVGPALSPVMHGLIITGSFLLPWVGTVFVSRLIETRFSVSTTLLLIWVVRLLVLVFLAFTLLFPSESMPLITALAILGNRVVSECVCRTMPLVESDLIDENTYLHSRSSSMSATVVGTVNFISKPSQSFGPMVGYAIMSRFSLTQFLGGSEGLLGNEAYQPDLGDVTEAQRPRADLTGNQLGGIVFVMVGLPLVCVCLQAVLWQHWTLQGTYLKQIKQRILALSDDHGANV